MKKWRICVNPKKKPIDAKMTWKMVWVYVLVLQINTEVLIKFFVKKIWVLLVFDPWANTHENWGICVITKRGSLDTEMSVKEIMWVYMMALQINTEDFIRLLRKLIWVLQAPVHRLIHTKNWEFPQFLKMDLYIGKLGWKKCCECTSVVQQFNTEILIKKLKKN